MFVSSLKFLNIQFRRDVVFGFLSAVEPFAESYPKVLTVTAMRNQANLTQLGVTSFLLTRLQTRVFRAEEQMMDFQAEWGGVVRRCFQLGKFR